MRKEIASRLNHIKERLIELRNFLAEDVKNAEVSEKVLNVTQEVLETSKRVMDNAIFDFVERSGIINSLSEFEIKQVYFPIADDRVSFERKIAKAGMKNLSSSHPEVFEFLEKQQPYNSDKAFLKNTRDYANLGHRTLTPQEKKKVLSVTVAGALKIGSGASIKNLTLNGWGIKEISVGKEDIRVDAQEGTPIQVRAEIFNLVSGTPVDVGKLCIETVACAEEIAQKFSTMK